MVSEDAQFNDSLQQLRTLTEHLALHVAHLTHAPPAPGHEADSNLQRSYSEIDAQLGGFHKHLANIKANLHSTNLSVAVVALAKSGKSTLLNALIGRDILPSNNVPETARIVRINHDATAHAPLLHERRTSPHNATPELQRTISIAAIRTRLEQLNTEHRASPYSRSDDIELEITTRIAGLDDALGNTSGDSVSAGQDGECHPVTLQLIDTPGPNEAGEGRLRDQVARLLGSSVDAVLYVLDYTKLKTNEEADVLAWLKAENPALVQRLSSRLFFVVNKCDAQHTEVGLSDEATRVYVADLVTRHMAMPEFQLAPHQVLLISAREALLSRLYLLGHASDRDRAALILRAFGRFGQPPTQDQLLDAATRMLQASGVPELESTVLSFLYTKAGTLKLQAIADSLASLLGQLSNVYTTHTAALQYDCVVLVDKAAALQKELNATLERFDDVQSRASDIEGLVTDMLTERMEHLNSHLHKRVGLALGTDDQDAPQGRWSRVWRSARQLFTSAPTEERAVFEHMLRDLADDVANELSREVSHFWHATETIANEQQRVLFASLNSHIRAVAKAVEGEVAGVLDVQLEPVDLSLEPPSPEQFHLDLQALLNAGTVRRTREEQVNGGNHECRNSLCRFFGSNSCDGCRQAQYVRLVETYEVAPARVQTFFIEAIDEAVNTSCRHVRGVVRQFLASQTSRARTHLVDYCEQYSSTMLRAIDTSQQGEAARQLELERLVTARAAIKDLQAQLQACLGHLAHPNVQGAMHCALIDHDEHLDVEHADGADEVAEAAERDISDGGLEAAIISPSVDALVDAPVAKDAGVDQVDTSCEAPPVKPFFCETFEVNLPHMLAQMQAANQPSTIPSPPSTIPPPPTPTREQPTQTEEPADWNDPLSLLIAQAIAEGGVVFEDVQINGQDDAAWSALHSVAPDSLSDALRAGLSDADADAAEDNHGVAETHGVQAHRLGKQPAGTSTDSGPPPLAAAGPWTPQAPLLMAEVDAASVDVAVHAGDDVGGAGFHTSGSGADEEQAASSGDEWQLVTGSVGMPVAPNDVPEAS